MAVTESPILTTVRQALQLSKYHSRPFAAGDGPVGEDPRDEVHPDEEQCGDDERMNGGEEGGNTGHDAANEPEQSLHRSYSG